MFCRSLALLAMWEAAQAAEMHVTADGRSVKAHSKESDGPPYGGLGGLGGSGLGGMGGLGSMSSMNGFNGGGLGGISSSSPGGAMPSYAAPPSPYGSPHGQSSQFGSQSGQLGAQYGGQYGGQSGQYGGQSGQYGGQSGQYGGQSGQYGGQSGQYGSQYGGQNPTIVRSAGAQPALHTAYAPTENELNMPLNANVELESDDGIFMSAKPVKRPENYDYDDNSVMGMANYIYKGSASKTGGGLMIALLILSHLALW